MPRKAKAMFSRYMSRARQGALTSAEADATRASSTGPDGGGAPSNDKGETINSRNLWNKSDESAADSRNLSLKSGASRIKSGASRNLLPEFGATPLQLLIAAGLLISLATLVWVGMRGAPAGAAESYPGQGFLPDNRAWEMVSPPDKNGSDIGFSTSRTRISDDGNSAVFMSLGGFSGVQGVSAYGAEYRASRTDGGWSTHGITPAVKPYEFPQQVGATQYQGEFSSDLTTGVFLGPKTGEDDPYVANVTNLYLRDDLDQDDGSYILASGCPGCSSPLTEGFVTQPGIVYGGASSDFSHILFESTDNLTGQTTGNKAKAYEWVRATDEVRLVGILPDTACATPPCIAAESRAGNGAGASATDTGVTQHYKLSFNAISGDGSRIYFTGPTISGNGRVQTPYTGELYLRENGSTTIPVNVSERATLDPSGHKTATFWAASRDGATAFFTTAQKMTDDDLDTSVDLYRFDRDQPAGQRLMLISGSLSGNVNYVAGVSDDGDYVYFAGAPTGQWSDPGPLTATNDIYVWHDGAVRDIAGDTDTGPVGTTTLWPEQTRGGQSVTGQSNAFRVTPDGGAVAFTTTARAVALSQGFDTTPNPNGTDCVLDRGAGASTPGCYEVYVYNYADDDLSCASCFAGGLPTSDATFAIESNKGPGFGVAHDNNAISADGSRVFFSTGEALVPADQNGKRDVYVYDVSSGHASLLSSGQSSEDSFFIDADPSGDNAFFATQEQLVGIDTDNNVDLYDARVDGGLAAQNPPPAPPECQGDDCQNESDPPPTDDPPSSTNDGPGNPPAAADCSSLQERYSNLLTKKKVLRERAKHADGKHKQKLRQRVKKLRRQTKQTKSKFRSCREAQ